jgi:hypothetical protein
LVQEFNSCWGRGQFTDRGDGDLINLLLFSKNKESSPKSSDNFQSNGIQWGDHEESTTYVTLSKHFHHESVRKLTDCLSYAVLGGGLLKTRPPAPEKFTQHVYII